MLTHIYSLYIKIQKYSASYMFVGDAKYSNIILHCYNLSDYSEPETESTGRNPKFKFAIPL